MARKPTDPGPSGQEFDRAREDAFDNEGAPPRVPAPVSPPVSPSPRWVPRDLPQAPILERKPVSDAKLQVPGPTSMQASSGRTLSAVAPDPMAGPARKARA